MKHSKHIQAEVRTKILRAKLKETVHENKRNVKKKTLTIINLKFDGCGNSRKSEITWLHEYS